MVVLIRKEGMAVVGDLASSLEVGDNLRIHGGEGHVHEEKKSVKTGNLSPVQVEGQLRERNITEERNI